MGVAVDQRPAEVPVDTHHLLQAQFWVCQALEARLQEPAISVAAAPQPDLDAVGGDAGAKTEWCRLAAGRFLILTDNTRQDY